MSFLLPIFIAVATVCVISFISFLYSNNSTDGAIASLSILATVILGLTCLVITAKTRLVPVDNISIARTQSILLVEGYVEGVQKHETFTSAQHYNTFGQSGFKIFAKIEYNHFGMETATTFVSLKE